MPPIVNTKYGQLQGQTEDDLHVFRGIPFAAPPVGELRFRAPRPPEPWDGVKVANEPGPGSMQTFMPGLELLGAWEMPVDEDCLSLNIWTPGMDDAKRPVMFWIHGGGFSGGSGATPIYDGQHLSRRGDVVVVTINYRLGALGYLYNQALTDGDDPHSGNYGMRDQVAALQWVRDHISAFGGDPQQRHHLRRVGRRHERRRPARFPRGRGTVPACDSTVGRGSSLAADRYRRGSLPTLLRRARGQPGGRGSAAQYPGGRTCSTPKNALMADPETSALTGRFLMAFSPVVEGGFLETLPIDAVRSGLSKDVDVLCGTIEDEWTLLAALQGVNEMDETSARGALAVTAGDADTANQLYDHYRDARAARGAGSDPLTVYDSVMTDYVFRIPSDRLLDAHSALDGSGKTYAYLFNQQSPAMDGRLRAPHAIDIPFVWGTGDQMRPFIGEDPQTDHLSGFAMDAWISFARDGNPKHQCAARLAAVPRRPALHDGARSWT